MKADQNKQPNDEVNLSKGEIAMAVEKPKKEKLTWVDADNPNPFASAFNDLLCCDGCGICNEDVEKIICPYQEEINDIAEEAILCTDCYNERVMDI